jgi:hypothetical protein
LLEIVARERDGAGHDDDLRIIWCCCQGAGYRSVGECIQRGVAGLARALQIRRSELGQHVRVTGNVARALLKDLQLRRGSAPPRCGSVPHGLTDAIINGAPQDERPRECDQSDKEDY